MEGIEADARAEAERILTEARKAADLRLKTAGQQASSILEEARRKALEQVQAIRRNNASAVAVQTRRIVLRVREQVTRGVLDQVSRRLQAMTGESGYREILLGWIVEAAIGLNVPQALVSVSGPERAHLDAGLLREAEGRVKSLTGQTVRLQASEQASPLAQGVVLIAGDGRIAYNNQVSTRILRNQSRIRKIIHDEVFGELGKE
jgi:vacuolar-type H+-ATPase subunit E/Vma4